MTIGEEVICDYSTLRLTLKAHPVALLRGGPFKTKLHARGRPGDSERRASGLHVGGSGDLSPAPRHGERRDLHDAGGRHRGREYCGMAEDV